MAGVMDSYRADVAFQGFFEVLSVGRGRATIMANIPTEIGHITNA